MDTWTVKSVLEWIEGYLEHHGIAQPRVSARWLVADALGCAPIELYTDLERPLSAAERDTLRDYTARRAQGEPLQYITSTTDFRFITLAVEPGVLIPRPETEVLVSEALAELTAAFADIDSAYVVDLCTGSGNIACSIACELESARVFACDISPQACQLARSNASRLGVQDRVRIVECDVAAPASLDVLGAAHLVVSNPPYVPTAVLATLDAEVTDFEPRLALDGGADGLDVFRSVLAYALEALVPGGVLAVELHETCLDAARDRACDQGFAQCRVAADLAGRPRVLVCRKGQ